MYLGVVIETACLVCLGGAVLLRGWPSKVQSYNGYEGNTTICDT